MYGAHEYLKDKFKFKFNVKMYKEKKRLFKEKFGKSGQCQEKYIDRFVCRTGTNRRWQLQVHWREILKVQYNYNQKYLLQSMQWKLCFMLK